MHPHRDSAQKMLNNTLYHAKILLFGEYGIIEDSMGLSIPYTFYKGTLIMQDEVPTAEQKLSNNHLLAYYKYLNELALNGTLPCAMNLEKFKTDIDKGIYFDSSIPQGFGVGSSGALVAAVYDRYALTPITEKDTQKDGELAKLKQILSILESYFHGKSSGLDPLICYLNLPILIESKNQLGTVAIPAEIADGKGAIFLMNSGLPGKTQGMVTLFLEKLKNDGFRNMVKTQLKKYNDECIKAFLKGDTKPLFDNLKQLSQLFLDNFRPMIPDHFEELWRKGIETNSYYLKLCGSGGGGFVLGFTQDLETAKTQLKNYRLDVIHKF